MDYGRQKSSGNHLGVGTFAARSCRSPTTIENVTVFFPHHWLEASSVTNPLMGWWVFWKFHQNFFQLQGANVLTFRVEFAR